jgi:hypothetical protein
MAGDDGSVVVSDFRLSNLFARHEVGPQEETHDDLGDLSDLTDLDDDERIPASSVRPPSAAEEPRRRRDSPVVQAARQRWEISAAPLAPSSSTQTPVSQNPTGQTRKEKKTVAQRTARQVKREVMRDIPGQLRAPKAVALVRMRQSSPIPFDFKLSIHPAVASTGWMGLRAPPTDFEPEAWEYTLEEATEVPGMRVLEWQGYVVIRKTAFFSPLLNS